MIKYIVFKNLFYSLNDEIEIEIYFKNKKDNYILVKHHTYISFGNNKHNVVTFSSLDEFYNTKTIDNILLKDDWDNIEDILIDMKFSVVTEKEEIEKYYGFDLNEGKKMKYVFLGAWGPLNIYSVPEEVANNLEEYCNGYIEWLREGNDKEKYYGKGYSFSYDENDFIEYLNKYIFPDRQSEFIITPKIGERGEYIIPEKFKDCPFFRF